MFVHVRGEHAVPSFICAEKAVAIADLTSSVVFEYKASTKKYSQAKKSSLFISHSFAVDWKRDRSWIGSVYSYTVTVPAEDQHIINLLFILR